MKRSTFRTLTRFGMSSLLVLGLSSPTWARLPQVLTSAPEAALQIQGCLNSLERIVLLQAIRTDLQTQGFDDADVRAQCKTEADTEVLAIWFQPTGAYGATDTAINRHNAFNTISILQSNETFGVRIPAAGIRRNVNQEWSNMPKTYNTSGSPDTDGSVHLTDYNLAFGSIPARVVTTVEGWYDAPFPLFNVTFDVIVSDLLYLQNGKVMCTSDSEVDTNADLFNILGWFLGLPLLQLEGFGIAVFTPNAPVGDLTPGCAAAAMIPEEIMLPGGVKVVTTYSRLTAGSTGITAAGTHAIVPRTPSVIIGMVTSKNPLRVEEDQPAQGTYYIRPKDLRGPLEITWSVAGAPVISAPHGRQTIIKWNPPHPTSTLNATFSRTIHVHVTDDDGLEAGYSRFQQIKIVWDSSLPPLCDNPANWDKPQCDPLND